MQQDREAIQLREKSVSPPSDPSSVVPYLSGPEAALRQEGPGGGEATKLIGWTRTMTWTRTKGTQWIHIPSQKVRLDPPGAYRTVSPNTF